MWLMLVYLASFFMEWWNFWQENAVGIVENQWLDWGLGWLFWEWWFYSRSWSLEVSAMKKCNGRVNSSSIFFRTRSCGTKGGYSWSRKSLFLLMLFWHMLQMAWQWSRLEIKKHSKQMSELPCSCSRGITRYGLVISMRFLKIPYNWFIRYTWHKITFHSDNKIFYQIFRKIIT